ncbi:hypothetical protein [Methylobacterium sp. ID0610]
MARRSLCLFALLCVADAIVVHGRGPRPICLSHPEVEVKRIGRSMPA